MEKSRQHPMGHLGNHSLLPQFFYRVGTILLVLMFLTTTTVSPVSAITPVTTRYVSTGGTNSGDCTNSAAPCLTITYAVSQAVTGDRIVIAAGTYTETLNLSKAITLIGAGMDLTIIDGGSLSTVITAATEDLALTDLTVQHGGGRPRWRYLPGRPG